MWSTAAHQARGLQGRGWAAGSHPANSAVETLVHRLPSFSLSAMFAKRLIWILNCWLLLYIEATYSRERPEFLYACETSFLQFSFCSFLCQKRLFQPCELRLEFAVHGTFGFYWTFSSQFIPIWWWRGLLLAGRLDWPFLDVEITSRSNLDNISSDGCRTYLRAYQSGNTSPSAEDLTSTLQAGPSRLNLQRKVWDRRRRGYLHKHGRSVEIVSPFFVSPPDLIFNYKIYLSVW